MANYFEGFGSLVPQAMGRAALGNLNYLQSNQHPKFELGRDFEQRQYATFGRMLGKQQQAQERRINDMFARGEISGPQKAASILSNMYASDQVLGDMVQQSSIQNALRRLQEQQLLGNYRLGIMGATTPLVKHPLPGWVPPEQKRGWGGGLGQIVGSIGGAVVGGLMGGPGGAVAGAAGSMNVSTPSYTAAFSNPNNYRLPGPISGIF